MGASGTRNIGWQAKSPIPRLTPKLRGASPGITAGGTAGSCIWRSRSAASGSPVAAEFTIASAADNVIAPKLLTQLPMAVRYVLGDTHYNTPELRPECALHNRELVATRRGPYPHRDGGVEVRRIFHKLRSLAIEPFNGLFKNIFEWRGQLPVKGLKRCQLFALGAILLYQIVLLYQKAEGNRAWRKSGRRREGADNRRSARPAWYGESCIASSPVPSWSHVDPSAERLIRRCSMRANERPRRTPHPRGERTGGNEPSSRNEKAT